MTHPKPNARLTWRGPERSDNSYLLFCNRETVAGISPQRGKWFAWWFGGSKEYARLGAARRTINSRFGLPADFGEGR